MSRSPPPSNGGLLLAGARPRGERPLFRTLAGPPLPSGGLAPAGFACSHCTRGSSAGASREALARPQGPALASLSLPWPRRGEGVSPAPARHARRPDGEPALSGGLRTTASQPTRLPPAPALFFLYTLRCDHGVVMFFSYSIVVAGWSCIMLAFCDIVDARF